MTDVQPIEVLAINPAIVNDQPGVMLDIRPDPNSFQSIAVWVTRDQAIRIWSDLGSLLSNSPLLQDESTHESQPQSSE